MCFNKRGIFIGDLDFYCLVCEVIMKDKKEVRLHLTEVIHDQHLEMTFLSHPDDGIRKIKDKHYCEFCNHLMHSLKVEAHLKDETHLMYKSKKMRYTPKKIMKRENNALIAFNEYVVSDNAWHSIINHTCLLCDYTDITNFEMHKNSQGHVMKLIQAKTINMDNYLFRKFNEDIQCLICNSLMPANAYQEHFANQKHLKNYMQARKDRTSLIEVIVIDEEDIKDVKPIITNDAITNLPQTRTELAIDSNNYNALDLSMASINYRRELKRISQENDINPTITGELYCRVCQIRLSKTLNSVAEHIVGERHLQLLNSRPSHDNDSHEATEETQDLRFSTEQMNTFVKVTYFWRSTIGDLLIINNVYCINIFSMMTCTRLGNFLHCNVCEVSFVDDFFTMHTETPMHTIKLSLTMVVKHFRDEFIRELRSNVFHCGYCNKIEAGWDNIIVHLQTRLHLQWKAQAMWTRSEFSKVPSILPEYQLNDTVGLIKFLSQLKD